MGKSLNGAGGKIHWEKSWRRLREKFVWVFKDLKMKKIIGKFEGWKLNKNSKLSKGGNSVKISNYQRVETQ